MTVKGVYREQNNYSKRTETRYSRCEESCPQRAFTIGEKTLGKRKPFRPQEIIRLGYECTHA